MAVESHEDELQQWETVGDVGTAFVVASGGSISILSSCPRFGRCVQLDMEGRNGIFFQFLRFIMTSSAFQVTVCRLIFEYIGDCNSVVMQVKLHETDSNSLRRKIRSKKCMSVELTFCQRRYFSRYLNVLFVRW